MKRYIKLGYEGIELELPVHAVYLYRTPQQLVENILPLIQTGAKENEKCLFVGGKKEAALLKKSARSAKIEYITEKRPALDRLLAWQKSKFEKAVSDGYDGLRMFLVLTGKESTVDFETIADDFYTDPSSAGKPAFMLCLYNISSLSSSDMLDILKLHPFVFVEQLLHPNAFYSRIKHTIWTDALTGVFNRRYFDIQLKNELERSTRYMRHLSILMVDIDHFKKVNDEFGHQVGDRVLINIAKIVEHNIRGVDVVSRYGGDEFIVLLPETRRRGALIIAERLRKTVFDFDFFQNELSVREIAVSIGVASFPADAGTTTDLIKVADDLLYQAKRAGGNRVVTTSQ